MIKSGESFSKGEDPEDDVEEDVDLEESVKSPLLGKASHSRPPLVSSYVFVLLLCSASFFIVLHTIFCFFFFAKLQDAIPGLTWPLVFVPAFLGLGLSVACQICALCFLVVPIRWIMTLPPSEQAVLDGYPEYLLPVLRAVVSWTMFGPMLGLMPSIPLLMPVLALEIEALKMLEKGTGGGSTAPVFIPVLVMLGLGFAALACCRRRHDLWRGLNLGAGTALAVLAIVNVEGKAGISWWVVGIPLWIWLVAMLGLLIAVGVEAGRENGTVVLRETQRTALVMYAFAWAMLAIGSVLLCGQLERKAAGAGGGKMWFPGIGLIFCCAMIGIGLGYVVVLHEYLEEVRVNGVPVEANLDATWGSDVIEDEWPLLGVVVRRKVDSFARLWWRNGADVTGGVEVDEEEESAEI